MRAPMMRDDAAARRLARRGDRIDDGRADAAADAADALARLDVRRLAERAGDVEDARRPAPARSARSVRLADPLDDQRDGAARRVGVGDRQRDALAVLGAAGR